jgi:hypothetical protein
MIVHYTMELVNVTGQSLRDRGSSSLESLFKLGLDPSWAFSQIHHRFLNICVPIKTLK